MAGSDTEVILYTHGLGDGAQMLADALRQAGAGVRTVACEVVSRANARSAIAELIGEAATAIVAYLPDDRGPARPLLEWAPDEWLRCADEPQFQLLEILQGLRDALAGRPCSVVLLGASIGMTGAAGHVALSTATEGQRGLMKTLARQWGDSWRLNWVSVTTPLMCPDIDYVDIPEQCELGDYTPSLGRRPGWADVAQIALMLGTKNAAGITGQTLIVDGGEWMLP
ncbi:SDR family oxidoreductase [uncultured Sphingomonas sp.]|uniref:SDR family oxidoreductase n=1 Tax=uncultured Sphingomonas sp. TaxID=158754 RepID=UPI0025D4805B|nr:SDR family oxidoreductase [uncultured Sphingomonas sp.]